jgi:hypothetical protein
MCNSVSRKKISLFLYADINHCVSFFRIVSWPALDKPYKKISSSRPTQTSTTTSAIKTATSTTKGSNTTSTVYIVNEIVDEDGTTSTPIDNDEDSHRSKLQLNASDPSSFGINWDRLAYDSDSSNRGASMSSLLLFIMPLLLVLFF